MSEEALERIFTVNLGVREDETALVFTDIIAEGEALSGLERRKRIRLTGIARAAAEAGRGFCNVNYLEFQSAGGHGIEPPEEVWVSGFGKEAIDGLKKARLLEKILKKTATADDLKSAERMISSLARIPDCVVALSNYSTSHTRFRDLLTKQGARYASMPLFDEEMIEGAMSADWKGVEARTERLAGLMQGCHMVYVTSHNGTSICFSIKGREILKDTGILTAKGSFGNLPAGEAFLAPVEGTAEGMLVLEWSPLGKLKEPVELEVKNGMVVDVSGRDELAEGLREKIKINPLVGNIAELGIGTNDRASRPDNILETEKILGTVHIALGDNSSFGGKVSVPFHTDFIFFKPTLEAFRQDGKVELIIEGEPRF